MNYGERSFQFCIAEKDVAMMRGKETVLQNIVTILIFTLAIVADSVVEEYGMQCFFLLSIVVLVAGWKIIAKSEFEQDENVFEEENEEKYPSLILITSKMKKSNEEQECKDRSITRVEVRARRVEEESDSESRK